MHIFLSAISLVHVLEKVYAFVVVLQKFVPLEAIVIVLTQNWAIWKSIKVNVFIQFFTAEATEETPIVEDVNAVVAVEEATEVVAGEPVVVEEALDTVRP